MESRGGEGRGTRHTYPVRHLVIVGLPVMVVEDEDGEHDAARHHEHYAIEVSSWLFTTWPKRVFFEERIVSCAATCKKYAISRAEPTWVGIDEAQMIPRLMEQLKYTFLGGLQTKTLIYLPGICESARVITRVILLEWKDF